MSNWAITGAGVGKEYMIGARSAGYDTLRESISRFLTSPMRRLAAISGQGPAENSYWALQDVSFQVKEGDVLGLIGRNGAGKSTLLKILGRITAPTRGRVELRGRCASLLEVGTGFHPELTGRENIYLNGAILGMSQREITRKFEQIVDFAGVETFLDTPVKRYSSGMYVRLAFAVAANIEPEILLVDEVLAVGDLDFQKKCLDRMKSLAHGATTIIFVSHNMGAIQALCGSCLLLDQGRAVRMGPTPEIISLYVSQRQARKSYVRTLPPPEGAYIRDADTAVLPADAGNPSWRLRVAVSITSPTRQAVAVGLRLSDAVAVPVAFASCGHFAHEEMIQLKPGENGIILEMPIDLLALGEYTISIRMAVPFVALIEEVEDCLTFAVARAPRQGATRALVQSWGYGGVELPLRQIERTS